MRVVIAYDISSDRRRKKVADLLSNVLTRVRPLPVLRIRPPFLPVSERALVVPAVRDRVVQRAILDLLTPALEPTEGEGTPTWREGLTHEVAAGDGDDHRVTPSYTWRDG